MYLFDIGVINIRFLDILDILIVAYFMYLIYKLLRGTIAFNIIVGVLVLSIVWWIVNVLDMKLLILLLGKVVAYGVIILIIIFQPEVRRFLLYLGNSTLKGRFKFINKFFFSSFNSNSIDLSIVEEIQTAILRMSKGKIGALIVFTDFSDPIINEKNGTVLDAKISHELIESIFNKDSPLHDGAMVISENRIYSVGTILPVSSNTDISSEFGTRHRSGIGITEIGNSVVIIVSEETGKIAFSSEGVLKTDLDENQVFELIKTQIK